MEPGRVLKREGARVRVGLQNNKTVLIEASCVQKVLTGQAADTASGAIDNSTGPDERQLRVDALREAVVLQNSILAQTKQSVRDLQIAGGASTRTSYLRTLRELIGPLPKGRTWRDEIKFSPVDFESTIRPTVDQFVQALGWPRGDAETFLVLARALRNGDTKYAASAYALCDAFFCAVKRNQTDATPPQDMYTALDELPAADGWADIEKPDRNGFRGVTSYQYLLVSRKEACFDEHGFGLFATSMLGHARQPKHCDVVCIEAAPADQLGCHEPLRFSPPGCDHKSDEGGFLREINEFITQRRAQGSTGGRQMPAEHALLNLDEVLSVRLYSGPAYQLINGFLRQIGELTGSFRSAVAENTQLTFAATVGHLCTDRMYRTRCVERGALREC